MLQNQLPAGTSVANSTEDLQTGRDNNMRETSHIIMEMIFNTILNDTLTS